MTPSYERDSSYSMYHSSLSPKLFDEKNNIYDYFISEDIVLLKATNCKPSKKFPAQVLIAEFLEKFV